MHEDYIQDVKLGLRDMSRMRPGPNGCPHYRKIGAYVPLETSSGDIETCYGFRENTYMSQEILNTFEQIILTIHKYSTLIKYYYIFQKITIYIF